MPDQNSNHNDPPAMQLAGSIQLDELLVALRRRLIREASQAIDLLELAVDSLWDLDIEGAKQVKIIEAQIDSEEVRIEQECFRILALHQPFGADFRLITFCLKANSDIERVADHASSIAKICRKINPPAPQWPGALREMGQRVPIMCQSLLRAVVNTDTVGAMEVIKSDKAIDRLDKQVFLEVAKYLEQDDSDAATGMYMYRVSREIERVGDLLGNIAEDIVYLVTGEIVRHTKLIKK
ncbi:MAG: phosphate signaling complex protein PhoU [Phycisphaerales bacterium]|nr:phosphate signaling complex protein PhoU [Phycisphaerales bacterium]